VKDIHLRCNIELLTPPRKADDGGDEDKLNVENSNVEITMKKRKVNT